MLVRVRVLGLGHVRGIKRPVSFVRHLGQPKVENLGGSARGHKNVRRLDVAMHDALGVRGIQRFGHVNADREQRLHLQRPVADEMFQGLAFQVLHDNEGLVALFPDVVNSADVGMIERGRRLRLAAEAGESGGVAGNVFGKELQGNKAMQARVFSLVNHAHPATTELLDHPVVRDVLADHFAHEEIARNARRQTSGEPS